MNRTLRFIGRAPPGVRRRLAAAVFALAVCAYAGAQQAPSLRDTAARQVSAPSQPSALRTDVAALNLRIKKAVTGIVQVNHFLTGFDEQGQPLPVRSIDPAGIVYSEPLGALLIADSEITEVEPVFALVGATLFATPSTGEVTLQQWDLSQFTGNEPFRNRESTGIAYCPSDQHYYITNDDLDLIFRYAFDGATFTAVDSISTIGATSDPEGITCATDSATLYVIGGVDANISVYRYEAGFVLQQVLDLAQTAQNPAGVLFDAEGIAFDEITGHLFVLSDPDESIIEYQRNGRFVRRYDISGFVPEPLAPQGLTIGPSSTLPGRQSFYITDGGFDNDQVPDETDGTIYEALIERVGN